MKDQKKYSKPVMVVHFIESLTVICQSFGMEGYAGGDIVDGETYEFD